MVSFATKQQYKNNNAKCEIKNKKIEIAANSWQSLPSNPFVNVIYTNTHIHTHTRTLYHFRPHNFCTLKSPPSFVRRFSHFMCFLLPFINRYFLHYHYFHHLFGISHVPFAHHVLSSSRFLKWIIECDLSQFSRAKGQVLRFLFFAHDNRNSKMKLKWMLIDKSQTTSECVE